MYVAIGGVTDLFTLRLQLIKKKIPNEENDIQCINLLFLSAYLDKL